MEYLIPIVMLLLLAILIVVIAFLKKPRYDEEGYDQCGFNKFGYNRQGNYDRTHDYDICINGWRSREGFTYPLRDSVILTNHAKKRLYERLGITNEYAMGQKVRCAYRYGKSARQVDRSAASQIREIENRRGGSIVLIYKEYIYIFAPNKVLITVYHNDYIRL